MLKKSFLLLSLSVFILSYANAGIVEAQVALRIGDKVENSIVQISSEALTSLSMKDESLGFALRLTNETEGNERFEAVPTCNGQIIMRNCHVGKKMTFSAGSNINGHKFEKELSVEFISINKIS
jgi:hypothetical protein